MSRFLVFLCFSLVSVSPLTSCVTKPSGGAAADQEGLKKYVLDSVPEGITQLNINYGDKVTLVGYKLKPSESAKVGQQVDVTLYWRCDKELGEEGWSLFTHINDAAGKRIMNIDNVGPLRSVKKSAQALPPSAWKAGKVYQDEQSFTLPKKTNTSEIEITTGIFKGGKRLGIKAGPKDSDDRGLVAKLKVEGGKAPAKRSPRAPQLRVDQLEPGTKLKIDGKLDEDAWKTASVAGPFVDVKTGDANKSFPVNAAVKVLWDDKNLYLGFDVEDPDVIGGFKKTDKDPHLWTRDTVEIMLDPEGDGDNKDYYEIQVSPQNLVFDSQFDSYNEPRKEPDGPFGHQEWSSKLESAVVVNGTLDKSDDKDKGYTVEIRLPFSAFNKAKKPTPELGDVWRMNFYAMQNNGGVAWSPILGQGNFHKASRFGKVLWAKKDWKPAEEAKAAKKEADDGKPGDKTKGEAADKPGTKKDAPATLAKGAGGQAATKPAPLKAPEKPADPAVKPASSAP